MNIVPSAHAGLMDTIKQGQPSEFLIQPGSSISDILTGGGINLIRLSFFIIGLIFMFNIISAGWEYMQSSGDPKKVQGATTRFLNGFLGLTVAFFAFLIVNIITNMIGIGSFL